MPRTIALCAFGFLWALALYIFLILWLDNATARVWIIASEAIVPVVLLIIWGLFVLRPYLRMEKVVSLFMDGYTSEAELSPRDYCVSPAVERLIMRVIEQLTPSRMYDQNKRRAQYLALQNQINPHFLYNTLDSIRSEAMLAQLDSVAEMTEALASLFRYTISKVENLVSVEEELQNCNTYFRIQKYRFEDRLQMEVKYDPEEWEEIRRCRLPKLTLQPILENAIIHGTEMKIGTGKIELRFERTEKRLLIHIFDNGVGMDEETLRRLNGRLGKNALSVQKDEQRKGGLALVNVDHRIRLLFGDEYGLHIFSVLGYGTEVEVSIPMITSDHEVIDQGVLK